MVKRSGALQTKNQQNNAQVSREWMDGFSAFMEASLDACVLFDENLNILSANSAAGRLIGLSSEAARNAVGKNIVDLVPDIKETGRYEKYLNVVRTGEPLIAEDIVRHPKSGEIHLSVKAIKVGNGLAIVASDITKRKQAEEVRLAALRRVSEVMEAMPDAFIMLDTEGNVVQINSAYTKMFGLKAEEVVDKHTMELPTMTPEDAKKGMKLMSEVLKTGGTKAIDMMVYTKGGKEFPISATGTAVKDAEGNPMYFVSTMRDMTERKRAEEALRESEEKLRLMFESVTDGITVTDLEGKIVQVNDAALRMPGYDSKEELIGHSAFEFIAKKDHARASENLKRTLEEGCVTNIEYTFLTKDGKEYDAELSAAVIRDASGAPAGFIAVTRDITERKRAEDSLRHKEEYFRALTENSSDFIAVLNSDGSLRYESPSVERVLGYKPEERIGKGGLELIHPEDVSEVADSLVHLVENPGTTVHVQSRFQHKDGSWRVLDGVVQNLLDNPAVAGIVVNLRDITEHEKAEQALRESEHNYRALFESRIDGAAVIDAETMQVVLANPTAMDMYGFDSIEEVAEANLIEYVHPDDRDRALSILAEDLFEKDLRRVEEFRTITKDGEVRWIAGVGTRVEYQGRLAGLISFRDVTEQKRADEKLRELYEQERESRQQVEAEMKRRVEFTRALAHELKTPLTSVLASSDLLASELRDEALGTLANSIRQGASNLNSRIDELLDLARGEVGMLQLRLEAVDLSQLLRETADSMTPVALQRGLPLVLALSPSLPPVRADADRVQQVVTNLLSNALKFTPSGGNIRLGARQRGSAVVVEVRDTGRGMSREEQKGLFEPYHRLDKDSSGGLGLGLALCKMLVELHGGQIWVRSNVGRGSTFGFSLPLEAADEHAIESEEERKLWKVLIIEDDQEIVSFVRLAFQMRWPEAQLISTSLGEEGAELVETENPDLVILDLGLPDISGFDVLRQIRLFSSVPVVILTVKSDEADMVKGLEWGADDYVVKPFRQLELLARLKVQLRKQIPVGEEAPIICSSLRLDPSTYQLTYGGKEISLTIVEGRIMQHLMQNAGHVITHSRLAEAVWWEDHPGAIDSLRVYIRYLREKLEENPSHPKLILTKVGIGYLLAKPV